MTNEREIWQSSAVATSGIQPNTPAGDAITKRANILAMTQATEDAVLSPREPGAWPHALRAALASRIARHNRSDALATRYEAQCAGSPHATLADPSTRSDDTTLAAALTFVDLVATNPRDITADDIMTLQAVGIADADIVRLTEVVAFIAYQVRLTAGLALLAEIQS